MSVISFESEQWEKLAAHAQEGYPYEVVGLMAGDRASGAVSRVVALRNEQAVNAERRYQVSSLALMRAEQALEAEGLEIVGYYHSHPDHPSRYSETDREAALPNMSYTIVSVVGGKVANVQSWRLTEDRSAMTEETVRGVSPWPLS